MNTDLKSQLTLLKSLQDVDVSIHDLDVELGKIDIKISEAGAEYTNAKDDITRKESEKTILDKRRRAEESEINATADQLKDRESRLYAIKTNKEYQAAIKEIADSKQALKEREDSVFHLMEKIDGINEEITQLSAGLADKEKAFREKEAGLKSEADLIKEKKQGLLVKRTEAEQGVDKNILKRYRLVQTKYSDGMALALGGVCSGCNKKIPPQLYIELQKWTEVISCPNCHRLLFFQETEQAEETK